MARLSNFFGQFKRGEFGNHHRYERSSDNSRPKRINYKDVVNEVHQIFDDIYLFVDFFLSSIEIYRWDFSMKTPQPNRSIDPTDLIRSDPNQSFISPNKRVEYVQYIRQSLTYSAYTSEKNVRNRDNRSTSLPWKKLFVVIH